MLTELRRLAHHAKQCAGVAATAAGVKNDHPVTGPLYAQISVCDACDHRCAMCPYHPPSEPRSLAQFGGDRPGVMARATFDALVDDLHRLGTRRIELVGRGEPLLNPHIAAMVAGAKARGMTVSVISNGSNLDAARAEAFVRAGLDRFRLSLDAASAESYARIHVGEDATSFERAKRNLRALADMRTARRLPHLTVSFTIGAPNHHELAQMIDVAHAIGADAAHFQHVLPLSADAEALKLDDAAHDVLARLIVEAETRAADRGIETNLESFAAWADTHEAGAVPCYVGSYFTVVLGNGNVMPCCQTERPLGALGDDGFESIWKGDGYREFRRAARRLPEPSPALDTCACDRCYFRPHNVSVHNAIHPLSRIAVAAPAALLSATQLLRMTRLDRGGERHRR